MDIHICPVQHISYLTKVSEDQLPGQEELPPLSVILDSQEEDEVERIEDSRIFNHQLQYIVNWEGYYNQSWETVSNVDGHKPLISFMQNNLRNLEPQPQRKLAV